MSDADPERTQAVYGEAWVYESIVGAIPGVDVSDRTAVLVQFAGFEAVLLTLAFAYDLPGTVVPGTAAVVVAAAGSAFMLDIGRRARNPGVPVRYRRLLFASSIEVVLGVVAYVALLTYLFVYDPRDGATLFAALLGEQPPVLPAAFALLVLWDVCYRIGTGWWAAVVALWRSLAYDFDADTAAVVRAVDRRTLAFGALQTVMLPFVWTHPPLVVAVAGHVAAVVLVATGSLLAIKQGG
ncbi:hypothetical protein LPA44_11835 [Halobacterium sp. KA-4]|uniref:DUF7530 family protein n=1 Tax=Halobacterium sp. KA-4 TaxID=2896367 RepID=UPI001E50FD31|nr:hypothetical protein [Halobacterium sp. KA-4]MCD2200584.1 hypothetical protein [Halobacterium sp. KA-4]